MTLPRSTPPVPPGPERADDPLAAAIAAGATGPAAEAAAATLDASDPLAAFRDRFHLPVGPDGDPAIYLAGQSLGLQPRTVRQAVDAELEAWARLGVEGHFRPDGAWVAADRALRAPMARLVGAGEDEVAIGNTLTVNLHLLLASFFRPVGERTVVLIDGPAFPSDRYAVESHVAHHGLDPALHVSTIGPRPGEWTVRPDDLLARIDALGGRLAMTLLNGVNYATGQAFDIAGVTAAIRRVGAVAGWDLAHAAGNIPLALHAWDVDCAAWCTYKYLNSGPGAIAALFVHERHGAGAPIPRLAGWWGNRLANRFDMAPTFEPEPGAAGWTLSTTPTLAVAPIGPSLAIFEEAGMDRLRAKSMRLTGYLEGLLDRLPSAPIDSITPRDPAARGAQLSLRFAGRARTVLEGLEARGVVADFREPDIIRVAPIPLYTTYDEVRRFAAILDEVLRSIGGRP